MIVTYRNRLGSNWTIYKNESNLTEVTQLVDLVLGNATFHYSCVGLSGVRGAPWNFRCSQLKDRPKVARNQLSSQNSVDVSCQLVIMWMILIQLCWNIQQDHTIFRYIQVGFSSKSSTSGLGGRGFVPTVWNVASTSTHEAALGVARV